MNKGVVVKSVKDLKEDIKSIGLPVISLHTQGLVIKVLPAYLIECANSLEFYMEAVKPGIDQVVASLANDSMLIETEKPLFADIKCVKCYLIQVNGQYSGNIFWPEHLYGSRL